MKEIYQKKRFQQDFNERNKNLGKKIGENLPWGEETKFLKTEKRGDGEIADFRILMKTCFFDLEEYFMCMNVETAT